MLAVSLVNTQLTNKVIFDKQEQIEKVQKSKLEDHLNFDMYKQIGVKKTLCIMLSLNLTQLAQQGDCALRCSYHCDMLERSWLVNTAI